MGGLYTALVKLKQVDIRKLHMFHEHSMSSASCRRKSVGWFHACAWACLWRIFQFTVLSLQADWKLFVHNDIYGMWWSRNHLFSTIFLFENTRRAKTGQCRIK